uniref:Uncharacterized protein n=1 Tax=Avena sativa TaxID=4498 RepID=A0ACD5YVP5_AVESA
MGKCNTKSAYRACLQNLQEQGEPMLRQVPPEIIQLLNQIWRNKEITPRVQAFGWRLLRKAMPTGARAGKYSKRISKLCCRCGMEEDEIHLFFTCNFARAAWFSMSWHIRTDILIINTTSLTHLLLKLLNMNHPYASLTNVLTFMWCLWKARNDCLFNRNQGSPGQVHHMANAIMKNLEMVDILQTGRNTEHQGEQRVETPATRQGATIMTDLAIQGPKIYSDAAWKTNKSPGAEGRATTGLGVFCDLKHGLHPTIVLIQAKIAYLLQIQHVTFLTDNMSVARAAATIKPTDQQVPWEIRQHIAQYKQVSKELNPNIYHIKRDINGVAHNCAHQAIRRSQAGPIFSCSNSAHVNGACPIALALQNLFLQGIILHAVNFLS